MSLRPLALEELARSVRGAVEVTLDDDGLRVRRLPQWTVEQHAVAGTDRMARWGAGVSLELHTAASVLRLSVTVIRATDRRDRAPAPASFAVDDGPLVPVTDGPVIVDARGAAPLTLPGQPVAIELPLGAGATARDVRVWLPHGAETVIHSAALDAEASAGPASALPRWTHYGSSISHGSDLDDPRAPWPVQAATGLALELTNTAIAGNAMLDGYAARAIAEHPADLLTLKVGINIVNGDAMRVRTFIPALHQFLDLVRSGHPRAPIVVITPLACPIHEQTPGPVREVSPGRAGGTPGEVRPGDGTLTLSVVRSVIADVVAGRQGRDDRLFLLDGLGLLGPDDAGLLYDDLHPDRRGHDLIASRFVAAASDATSPLGRALATVSSARPSS